MKRSLNVVLGMAVVLSLTVSCFGSTNPSDCRFVRPNKLIKLRDTVRVMPLQVLRINGDLSSILIVDDGLNEERTQLRTTKIDLVSDERTRHDIPYDESGKSAWPPKAYTDFVSGPPDPETHPLIASGKLRFEYLGRKTSLPFLQGGDGKWSVDREEIFTGTRRLMYGTRPLLEQDFVRMRDVGDRIHRNVQIEPDGDRIICKCEDMQGTWIAVYSKRTLEKEQASRKSK